MNEERIWELSRAWKHARHFAALCERHWLENYAALQEKQHPRSEGFKPKRKQPVLSPASIAKANATKQAKFIKKWQRVMFNLGWSSDTGSIANSVGTSSICIYDSMNKLVKLGLMSRKNGVRVKGRGRVPALWTWIGDRTL